MAFDNTLPAGGPANFQSPNTLFEAEGVGLTFLSVDYISAMNAETSDFSTQLNATQLNSA